MARKKIEKGSEEFMFFGDLFKFAEEFHEPEGMDSDYWEKMIFKSTEIIDKYNNFPRTHELALRLCVGFMDAMEIIAKENLKDGN